MLGWPQCGGVGRPRRMSSARKQCPMVPNSLDGNRVVAVHVQPLTSVSGAVDDNEVIVDRERAVVEANVVVGAKTQQIALIIWPIMRPPEGDDVGALCV